MLARRLSPGSTIGIFSPSLPAYSQTRERYEKAKDFLTAKGFNVVEGSLTGRRDFYRSGSVKERADELNALIHDAGVDCIMASGGGMNSNSILPYIDYGNLADHPKIVVGFSDVTAVLLAIHAVTGLVIFYGPSLVPGFGIDPPFVDANYRYFENALVKANELPFTLTKPETWTDDYYTTEGKVCHDEVRENRWLTVVGGKARGRLIGGNLNTMHGIFGTRYMPSVRDGDILLIEDQRKDAATLERSFSLLKLSGALDRVSWIPYSSASVSCTVGWRDNAFTILQKREERLCRMPSGLSWRYLCSRPKSL